MKKIFFVLLLFIFSIINVSADSDYINDYTLIDCVNWDNDSWISFDSTKPYSTLKEWIEKTIDYINSEVNKTWNEETASWLIFNIKVKCSFEDLENPRIDLWFKWTDFNNKLIIEWIDSDSFVIKNTKFKLLKWAWNIVFKNVSFLNDDMWYFEDQVFNFNSYYPNYPSSKWVEIYNSYFKLKNDINLGIHSKYTSAHYWSNWTRSYNDFYNYFNKLKIFNSRIDIELNWNHNFKMPFYLKDSKINFVNNSSTWIYDISFTEDWNSSNSPTINYSVFVSNEVDMWWNNLSIEDDEDITFLNNKIVNFNNIDLWWKWVFINNFIENKSSFDISKYVNLFNNIFKSWFESSYDTFNYRRNFSLEKIWSWGIGWIYKRIRDFEFWNIDINSADLFKEVTWKESANWLGDIYVIFSY